MANESHILKKIPLGTNLDDLFGKVKTVNNILPDEDGNVKIETAERTFTAFEVMPTRVDIEAGTSLITDTSLVSEYDETKKYTYGQIVKDKRSESDEYCIYRAITNITKDTTPIKPSDDVGNLIWMLIKSGSEKYTVKVPASSIEYIQIRTYTGRNDIDVVIDWGDGTIDKVSEIRNLGLTSSTKFTTIEQLENAFGSDVTICDWKNDDGDPTAKNIEHNISICHKYNIPEGENLHNYIVKIYGKDYWGIRGHNQDTYLISNGTLLTYTNLMSRILETDLPFASNVRNISSFASSALRIIEVVHNKYDPFLMNALNLGSMFIGCKNLKRVSGFEFLFNNTTIYAADQIFGQCPNLESFDIRLPEYWQGNKSLASLLNSNGWLTKGLSMDIIKVLPTSGFTKHSIDVGKLFTNCNKVTCSNYDKLSSILWNDTSITWTNTSDAFKGCSDEIRAHVPQSWGGTASDDIIDPIVHKSEVIPEYSEGTKIATIDCGIGNKKEIFAPSIVVDDHLDETSTNPVQNQALAKKIRDIDNEITTLYNLIEPLIADLEIKVNNLDSIDQTQVTNFYLDN